MLSTMEKGFAGCCDLDESATYAWNTFKPTSQWLSHKRRIIYTAEEHPTDLSSSYQLSPALKNLLNTKNKI